MSRPLPDAAAVAEPLLHPPPPTKAPPPAPAPPSRPSILHLALLRFLLLLRSMWLSLELSWVTLQCLGEWWAFSLATADPPSWASRIGGLVLSPFDPAARERIDDRPVIAVAAAAAAARPRKASPSTAAPAHVAIIGPCAAPEAWGPYAPSQAVCRMLLPRAWVPSPEAQIMAAVTRLVHAIPATTLKSVTVLLTPGLDSGALLAELHAASHVLPRPLEVVTPRAAAALTTSAASTAAGGGGAASLMSVASVSRTNALKPASARVGAHGDRPGATLTVYLADPALHGKPLVARYASPVLSPTEADPARISRAVLPDPDLLIVAVPSPVLLGFPPWGLRVTEIHHERAAWWLTPARVARALRRYRVVEQRYGK
ncbi:hypothetical protein H9P43_004536 [Blastocladiella emersonii ATCC 22665]|nr:hypothetical protein H9P43_004536 [Blastocladiella emersonii ATCC 22665]